MDKAVVFPDTNGFIQVKDLKDLPWGDLFPGVKHVAIMVARPVISELDKHKVSTKARCRNRARAALKLIDQASSSSERSITLREEPIRVTLTVAPRARPNWNELPDLEPNEPDDQLVAAALVHAEPAVLLSHDSGPRISARDVGLTALEPPEGWLLPAEQTDDQRKAAKLERQLKEAENRQPRIDIEFTGSENGKLRLYRPKLGRLPPEAVADLKQRYLDRHPRAQLQATIFPLGIVHHSLTGYRTEDDVEDYNRAHAAFVREVGMYFEKLHERAALVASAPEIHFALFNAGGASAEHLKVMLDVTGEIGILASDDDVKAAVGSVKVPIPPKIPKLRHSPFDHDPYSERMSNLLGLGAHNDIHQPRDPTEMRWIDRPGFGGQQASYGCGDFRPKRKYEETIWLWPRAILPVSGTFTVKASANHMEEMSAAVEIIIEERDVAWTNDEVLELFPEFIRAELKKLG